MSDAVRTPDDWALVHLSALVLIVRVHCALLLSDVLVVPSVALWCLLPRVVPCARCSLLCGPVCGVVKKALKPA